MICWSPNVIKVLFSIYCMLADFFDFFYSVFEILPLVIFFSFFYCYIFLFPLFPEGDWKTEEKKLWSLTGGPLNNSLCGP